MKRSVNYNPAVDRSQPVLNGFNPDHGPLQLVNS